MLVKWGGPGLVGSRCQTVVVSLPPWFRPCSAFSPLRPAVEPEPVSDTKRKYQLPLFCLLLGANFSYYLFVAVRGPLTVVASPVADAGSAAMAYGPSCSAACGIFPDQGTNPCSLHRQADSQPLCHQGSPMSLILKFK